MWLSAHLGALSRNRTASVAKKDEREEFGVVQTAILTLLGLLIGFSFPMAVSRYDLRKIYEEAEANAIGTEYVRADLLPASEAAEVRGLLREYLDQRILFYMTRDQSELAQINTLTSQLQAKLWSVVQTRGVASPATVTALAGCGHDTTYSTRRGATQFAWCESYPRRSLGSDGSDSHRLQSSDRLWRAPHGQAVVSGFTTCRFDIVFPHCRH